MRLVVLKIVGFFFLLLGMNQITAWGSSKSQRIDSLLNQLNTLEKDTNSVINLLLIGDEYERDSSHIAIIYYKSALDLARDILVQNRGRAAEHRYLFFAAKSALYLGIENEDLGISQNAIELLKEALGYYTKLNNQKRQADCLNNIGNIYLKTGKYHFAINYYQKSLRIAEDIQDFVRISKCLNNIGILNIQTANYKYAIEYFNRSITISGQLNDTEGISYALNNLGNIYLKMNNPEIAIEYFEKSLIMNRDIDNQMGISRCLNNIGIIHKNAGRYHKAEEYYLEAIKICQEKDDLIGLSSSLNNLGILHLQNGRYYQAILSLRQSLASSSKMGARNEMKDTYLGLAQGYAAMQQFENAYENQKLYASIKDSMFNEESSLQLHEMEIRYQTEKKQNELELTNIQLSKQGIELTHQKTIKFAFIAGFSMVLLLMFIIVFAYNQKRKANLLLDEQKKEIEHKNDILEYVNSEISQQKEEIENQRDEIKMHRDQLVIKNESISLQRDQIELQKREITDSILYAWHIQQALLPPQNELNEMFPENFVMFRPKDIVSGDFYWISQRESLKIAAVADCVGHGVPGAFLSLLGISLLNRIVNELSITESNLILDKMRIEVIKSLHQTGRLEEAKDGLDISICVWDTATNIVHYSGANSPICLIPNLKTNMTDRNFPESMSFDNNMVEIKSDKMAIGIQFSENPGAYSCHTFSVVKGDILYLFTDGFSDQFGGVGTATENEFGTKYLHNNFKQLLVSIHSHPMAEQKHILEKTYLDWKRELEQLDDVTVFGIKIIHQTG